MKTVQFCATFNIVFPLIQAPVLTPVFFHVFLWKLKLILIDEIWVSGADPGFDQGGGAPDRDRPKTAILGPQFCRILVLGPHFWWSGGGARAPGPPPPGSAPGFVSA